MPYLGNGAGYAGKSLEIRDQEDILTAMQMTKTLAEELGFSAKETLFLQLATEEACKNAYDHGALEQKGYFEIRWTAIQATIEIAVCQESRPFDADLSALEKLAGQNEGPRGRGLVLIAGLMDELGITRSGRLVKFSMRKTRRQLSDAR